MGVLLMTGCMKIEIDVSVHEDDTVSGTVVMAISKQVTRASEIVEQMRAAVQTSDQVKVEPYEDDGHLGYRVTYDRVSLTQFNRGTSVPTGRATGPGLRRDGDFFVLGEPNAAIDPALEELPIQPIYRMKLTFPGAVVESNGTANGNAVEWNDMSVAPYAKAHARGSLLVPLLVGLGIALVVAALVVVAVIMVRGRARARQPALSGPPSPWESAPSAGTVVQPQPWAQQGWGQPAWGQQPGAHQQPGAPSSPGAWPPAGQSGGPSSPWGNQPQQGPYQQPPQQDVSDWGNDSPWSRP